MVSVTTKKGWIRKSARALLSFSWPVLLTIMLVTIFLAVIAQVFGDLDRFREWQRAHYGYMLAWRLMVYAVIALGWFKIRAHLKEKAPSDSPVPPGLRRCEGLAILVVCLFELRRAGLFEGAISL